MRLLRVVVALVAIAAAVAAAYGLLIDRSGAQITIATASLAVLGIDRKSTRLNSSH